MADYIHDDEKKFGTEDHGKVETDFQVVPVYDNDGPVEFAEKAEVRRGLHQRHIQMIALVSIHFFPRCLSTTLLIDFRLARSVLDSFSLQARQSLEEVLSVLFWATSSSVS